MNKTNLERIAEIKKQLKVLNWLRDEYALNDQGRKIYDKLLDECLDLESAELKKEHQEKAEEFQAKVLDLLKNGSDPEIENVFSKKIFYDDFTRGEIIHEILHIIKDQPGFSNVRLFKLLRAEYFRAKGNSNEYE